MSEDTPDPDDQFEDQLSDVGSRTREKFSAEERKKAEKLGVSPGDPDASTDDATDADTADGDTSATADTGTDADDGSDSVDADDDSSSGDIENETDDGETRSSGSETTAASSDVESGTGDDSSSPDSNSTGVTNDEPAPTSTAADRTQPSASEAEQTGSGAGTVYEYNDMNSKLEHEPESSVDQQPTTETATEADTNQSSGAMAGFGGVTTGERMAVTKTEVDFVTGDEAQTNETEQTKLLYFELNDELFAAPLGSISSVEELSGLTRYPRSPEPIDGVTDMRGKIIAVLNPKVIVDLSNASHENGAGGDYIIVQEEIEDEHRIGVRVDDISHVESASEESITPIYDITEMDLVTIDESYLEGIIHGYRADEQAQVPLVDFTALMETLKEY